MSCSSRFLKKLLVKSPQPLLNFVRCCSSLVRLSSNNEDLVVKLENNSERFPLVWLRDNCRCNQCFHPGSQSRTINWNYFKTDPKVKTVETTSHAESVVIHWDDDHKSEFTFKWLKERSFVKEFRERYLEDAYRPSKILWDKSEFSKVSRRYDYKDVMSSNEQLYNWLSHLAKYGVAFLKNAPVDQNECRILANKIAFIRKTHYGEEFYVTAKPGTSNVAYLSNLLQLHTDLPYYEYKPGVTILHCIEQTQGRGGENLLTDVFFVAEKLRKENKKVFDILSTVDVNWLDIGVEDGVKYHKIFRCPVFSLDSEGNLEKVRHSVPQRDSHFSVDVHLVKPWYEALRIFVDLINKHACKFKTKPGEMFAFDNVRLVHGRLGYEDTYKNNRFLVGFYLDWDEIFSKMRVLQKNGKK